MEMEPVHEEVEVHLDETLEDSVRKTSKAWKPSKGHSNINKQPQSTLLQLAKQRWHQHKVIHQFVTAVKMGDTNKALEALAQNTAMLSKHSIALDGDTVWHLLAEYGDVSLLSALVNYIRIHSSAQHIRTPKKRWWHFAFISGKYTPTDDSSDVISELVNITNGLQQTPLMFAAYHGRDEVIRFLMEKGADPWARDNCGKRTALHYGAMRGHVQVVRAIMDSLTAAQAEEDGVRMVDARTISGLTPLHYAVAARSLACTRALLAHDPCIHAYSTFDAGDLWVHADLKSTPLHLAAVLGEEPCALAILRYYSEVRHDHEEAVKEAAERGRAPPAPKITTDPRLWMDITGQTPSDVAFKRGHPELASKLHERHSLKALWLRDDLAALHTFCNVPQLKTLAILALQSRLPHSIVESVEMMKMLGTLQTAGRVFARAAVTSEPRPSSMQGTARASAGSAYGSNRERDIRESQDILVRQRSAASQHNAPQVPMLGVESLGSLNKQSSMVSVQNPSRVSHPSNSQAPQSVRGQSHAQSQSQSQQQQAEGAMAASLRKRVAKMRDWVGYNQRGVGEHDKHAGPNPMMRKARANPLDPPPGSGLGPCSCLASACFPFQCILYPFKRASQSSDATGLGTVGTTTLGDAGDLCLLCEDNRALLCMQRCGHRTCVMCAQAMCHDLEMKQPVLCPFCKQLVYEFQVA